MNPDSCQKAKYQSDAQLQGFQEQASGNLPLAAKMSKPTDASSGKACKSSHSEYENMLFERVVRMSQRDEIIDREILDLEMEDEGPERSSSLEEAISPSKLLKALPAQKEVS